VKPWETGADMGGDTMETLLVLCCCSDTVTLGDVMFVRSLFWEPPKEVSELRSDRRVAAIAFVL